MYSNEKSVQILVALLKKKNIKHVVLSPGGSDAPIVKSFEYDGSFRCYSVVDERNAVYFAIGIAQEASCPVVCVCTAGTAVSNYLAGITEAYYQNVPIIAITSDGNPYYFDQLELQKIDQPKIFEGYVKKSVSLPTVQNAMDEWYCNRIVNEALLELEFMGKGPVHINVPIAQTMTCSTYRLNEQRVISRNGIVGVDFDKYADKLKNKKIMIIAGQNITMADKISLGLSEFFEHTDSVISVETISNINCNGTIQTYPITETGMNYMNKDLVPDIVISLGNYIASYKLKELFRTNHENIENWLISESGKVRDPYHCLTEIFVGSIDMFLDGINKKLQTYESSHEFYNTWKLEAERIVVNDEDFSSLSIARRIADKIPDGSILHTSILNSTRVMQFFNIKSSITYYSNLGALGIDGCVSTFMGQAIVCEGLAYLLIGDLSFFYGMNAAAIQGIKDNVRIILLNNGGGEEFKIKLDYEEMDKYICARRSLSAKGWVESVGYKYFSANDNKSLDEILDVFAKESDTPLFLEIFLDMDKDSEIIKCVYRDNTSISAVKDSGFMGMVKSVVPQRFMNKAKEIIQVIKE